MLLPDTSARGMDSGFSGAFGCHCGNFYYLFQEGFLLRSRVRSFCRNHYLILRNVQVVPHCWIGAPARGGRQHLGALAALAWVPVIIAVLGLYMVKLLP